MRRALPIIGGILPMLLGSTLAGQAEPNPLADHRWRDRVLLAVADRADDPRVEAQRRIFHDMGPEARDRNLVLVVMTGLSPETTAVRRRFGLASGFHALLIGKDGGAKRTAETPLRAETLTPLIDAMPMRQDEMRRRR